MVNTNNQIHEFVLAFDPMERPLFEVGTPLLQLSSRPILVMDQHLTGSSGLPIKPIHLNPRPFSSSPPLPPQSPPQPPPRPPPQIVAQQIVPQQMAFPPNVPSPRQPSQSDNSPRVPFHLEFPRQPQSSISPVRTVLGPSSLGILNQDRIHVEGFQPIERRFASTKRRRSPVIIGDLTSGEDAKEEEFLPVEPSGRKLSAVELFDQSNSEVANDVGSDGSGGDFQNLSRFDYISSRNLRPESGYQVSATRLSNGFLKFRNTSNIISRVQQEEAEEESNSILDQEGGSGFGEDIDVSTNNENVIEAPLPRSFHTPVEVSEESKRVAPVEFGTTEKPLISDFSTKSSNNMTVSTVDETTTVELPSTRAEGGFFAPTASPNSVPCEYCKSLIL